MALNETLRGGIEGSMLPFPLDQVSTATNNEKLLGRRYKLKDGLEAILVKSAAIVAAPAKMVFGWEDTSTFEAELTTETTDKPVGIAHPNLGALAAGDYFLLLTFGTGGRVTCIAEGDITAGNAVIPAATSGQVDDSAGVTITNGITVGYALGTGTDGNDIDVLLVQPMHGLNV